MKRWIVLIALLLTAIAPGSRPSLADELRPATVTIWRSNNHPQQLPFMRGERAQSVWASGACWTECGSYCAWALAGCLERNAQGQCLKLTDKCDRYCQRECRTMGGPLLPIEFPWE